MSCGDLSFRDLRTQAKNVKFGKFTQVMIGRYGSRTGRHCLLLYKYNITPAPYDHLELEWLQ